MARSAAQRASRRLSRHLRLICLPTFPLDRLPPELQLLVLCKCDPTSIRRLLRLSTNLRTLFLSYSESCLQQILQELPRTLANLLRASWMLHNVDSADFDTEAALDLLRQSDLTEHTSRDAQVLAEGDDPLLVVGGLMTLYEEVEVGAELYAQSLNAAMETFVNPCEQIKPVVLSPTEHFRIACAFWILKIYYQLHLKLYLHPKCDEFRQAFVARLLPWQVQQVASLEQFLHNVGNEQPTALYTIIDTKFSSWEELSDKSLYFRNYFHTLGWSNPHIFPVGQPVTFCAASQTLRDIRRTPQGPPPWSVAQVSPDVFLQLFSTDYPLWNYGWICYDWILNKTSTSTCDLRSYFSDLGLFFWDYNRLARWHLADLNDFKVNFKGYWRRTAEASQIAARNNRSTLPVEAQKEEQSVESIAEWTRCPVQCTFEEWSYQPIALSSYAARRIRGSRVFCAVR